jgi:hypothetical protein
VISGARKNSVKTTITFGDPPKVDFGSPRESASKRHK